MSITLDPKNAHPDSAREDAGRPPEEVRAAKPEDATIRAPSSDHLYRNISLAGAINSLHKQIERSAWSAKQAKSPWSRAVCALILALDPACRLHKVTEALPYGLENFSHDAALE